MRDHRRPGLARIKIAALFVRGGGAIAVTTCDAAMCLPRLQRLFGVTWRLGGYYRTTWGPAAENASAVASTFPGDLATSSFSAKAHAVRQVPEHERIYGTTPDSRSQSQVPFMAGRSVGERTDADTVTSVAAEDYDVVVAKKGFGEGFMALFCDINMQAPTVQRSDHKRGDYHLLTWVKWTMAFRAMRAARGGSLGLARRVLVTCNL